MSDQPKGNQVVIDSQNRYQNVLEIIEYRMTMGKGIGTAIA